MLSWRDRTTGTEQGARLTRESSASRCFPTGMTSPRKFNCRPWSTVLRSSSSFLLGDVIGGYGLGRSKVQK